MKKRSSNLRLLNWRSLNFCSVKRFAKMNAFFIAESFKKLCDAWRNFPLCLRQTFCHAFSKLISARGILPFCRQANFSTWRFATRSPSCFQHMAFCHASAKLISARGISPFARKIGFRAWCFATTSLV